jgi:hypothetical protein
VEIDVSSEKGLGCVYAEGFHFSPLRIVCCYSTPATSADWKPFSPDLDVNFNIVILTVFMPRVSASFHESTSCKQMFRLFGF